MKLKDLGEASGGLRWGSAQGCDKTSGFGLIQLDGIETANDFLRSVLDMGTTKDASEEWVAGGKAPPAQPVARSGSHFQETKNRRPL